MNFRTRVLFVLCTLLCILAIVSWYFSPHLSARALLAAARTGDVRSLRRTVDFPALRESIKDALLRKLAAEAHGDSGEPVSSLGPAVASPLVTAFIDALVTPDNLALMLQGNAPPGSSDRRNVPGAAHSDDMPAVDVAMAYEGINRFVVRVRKKGTTEPPVGFVFTRSGLFSWRLSGLDLPL